MAGEKRPLTQEDCADIHALGKKMTTLTEKEKDVLRGVITGMQLAKVAAGTEKTG